MCGHLSTLSNANTLILNMTSISKNQNCFLMCENQSTAKLYFLKSAGVFIIAFLKSSIILLLFQFSSSALFSTFSSYAGQPLSSALLFCMGTPRQNPTPPRNCQTKRFNDKNPDQFIICIRKTFVNDVQDMFVCCFTLI